MCQMVCTGQCGPFGPSFHFLWDIYSIHTVQALISGKINLYWDQRKDSPTQPYFFSLGVGMCNQGAAMDIQLIRSRTRHVPVTSAKDSILEASTLRYYH